MGKHKDKAQSSVPSIRTFLARAQPAKVNTREDATATEPKASTTPAQLPAGMKPAAAMTPAELPADIDPEAVITLAPLPADIEVEASMTPAQLPAGIKLEAAMTSAQLPAGIEPEAGVLPAQVSADSGPSLEGMLVEVIEAGPALTLPPKAAEPQEPKPAEPMAWKAAEPFMPISLAGLLDTDSDIEEDVVRPAAEPVGVLTDERAAEPAAELVPEPAARVALLVFTASHIAVCGGICI